MNRTLKILLGTFFLLGFFLIPVNSFACELHSKKINDVENSCCNLSFGEKKDEIQKGNCCKDCDSDSSNCSGNCGMISCNGSSQIFYFQNMKNLITDNFTISNKKLFTHYKQPYFFSLITSIWHPPKSA